MRILPAALGLAFLLAPGVAVAQTLPPGIYDCTNQPADSMKMLPIGILKVTPEGFSGPQAEDAEDDLYVYLLNPDGTVNFPNEFAKNIDGGVEVVESFYHDYVAVVMTQVLMTDGTVARIACRERLEE